MPTFRVTDRQSGRIVKLTGDSPPSEQELEQIFTSLPQAQPIIVEDNIAVKQPVAVKDPAQKISAGGSRAEFLRQARENIVLPDTGVLAKDLPSIGSSPEFNELSVPSFLANVGATFSTRNEEVAEILKAQFPGTEIRQDSEGDLVAKLPSGGEFSIGSIGQTVAQTFGLLGAFTPAAKAAAIPKSLAAKAAVGVGTSGLTQTALEGLQTSLGGELNPEEIALAGVFGGAAELAIPAIQAIRGARTKPTAQPLGETVTAAREATEKTGVPLFKAQQTLDPAQLEKQSFVAQLPAGAARAREQLTLQNQAASRAVDDLLEKIAPPTAITRGPRDFRKASETAIEATKQRRELATSGIFKNAFRVGGNVNLKPVNSIVDDLLASSPEVGKFAKSLKTIQDLINPPSLKGTTKTATLRQLQKAKFSIDDMLEDEGANALSATLKRDVLTVKQELVRQMEAVSPEYLRANREFARLSPAVEALEESIIGAVSRMKDVNLKDISGRIFNPKETNTQTMRQAKKVIDSVDPDAWNNLLRAEVEKRIGSVKADIAGGTLENLPGQLNRAIFGNKKQTDILINAADSETRKNMNFLKTALERASLGRPGGSPTAGREEIKKELKGGVTNAIRNFFSSPIKTTAEIGEDQILDRRVKAMADAFFDPKWQPALKKIRQMPINAPATARAMTQLLRNIESSQPQENK